MSAALSLAPAGPSNLDRLTSPFPSAEDLRARAAFWRQYAFRESGRLGSEQSRRILSNCDGMDHLALELDNPSPVARLVAKQPRPRKQVIEGKVSAPAFWSMHASAVRSIAAEHGERWFLTAPADTILVSVPTRLRSYIGPLGGRITWRRDWRMPAARYWPDGVLPAGLELPPVAPRYTGPMGDNHPSMVMIRAAVAEQIVKDRLLREDARNDWANISYPPMLTTSQRGPERMHSNMQENNFRRDR